MIDSRLYTWQILDLVIIILFPFLRKITAWNIHSINKEIYRSLIPTIVVSTIIQVLFINEIFGNTEFIYLQLIVIIFYSSTGFVQLTSRLETDGIKLREFNMDIVKKIARAYGGRDFMEEDRRIIFNITTPLRMRFDVITEVKDGIGHFEFTSRLNNNRIYKLILLLTFYLTSTAVTTNSESVKFPFLDNNVSAVLSSIIAISLVILINYMENNAIITFQRDFTKFYSKALRKSALDSSMGIADTTVDIKSKAQKLLDKRDTNVLIAKKSEVQNKINSVFGFQGENTNLDPKVIERVRLMNAVKRVLNSTPPWKTVSLSKIVKIVKGNDDEVEKIIAGLKELKEINGIYDIWKKEYHGTSMSQLKQTQNLMTNLSEHQLGDKLQSIRIYPDGSSELYLTDKEGKSDEV